MPRAAILGLLALFWVTGYTLPGLTADGTPTGPGVAACPASMPFGTVLDVEGVGMMTCHDRYAPWLSDRIDCWMPTVAAAYAITGQRRVTVVA